jgi:hypothetical protein
MVPLNEGRTLDLDRASEYKDPRFVHGHDVSSVQDLIQDVFNTVISVSSS